METKITVELDAAHELEVQLPDGRVAYITIEGQDKLDGTQQRVLALRDAEGSLVAMRALHKFQA